MTRPFSRLSRPRVCRTRTWGAACMALLTGTTGCVVPVFRAIHVFEVNPRVNESAFATPVRAYLSDGSIVVLPDGGRIETGELVSTGWRYALTLQDSIPFSRIPTDSVVAVEVFSNRTVNEASTVLLTAASAVVGTIGTVALFKAIFGSCPTIYAEVDGEPVLQMEAFSYSIAPLFEARDVERLGVFPGEAGTLRLELRNEALETHYINHLELLDVRHARESFALPDPSGRPITMSGREAPLSAVNRDGRDVLSDLMETDGIAFRSSRSRLAAATPRDMTDHLDLVLPVPEGSREIALGLRMRNTLLNSALFYDIILAEAGVAALDWLGADLDRIGTALQMGRWYQGRMGLRVLVQDGSRYREVVHLPDAGPIGWKELAIPITTRGAREVRVRLEFISDSWFIDQAFVASDIERPQVRRIPVARITDAEGARDEGAVAALAAADSDYMVTFPGQRYQVDFQVDVQPEDPAPGHADPDAGRTLLLAAQGYYVEWIRGNWLEGEGEVRPFRPSDDALLSAMRIWEETMEEFERDFAATRIPVR